MGRPERYVEDYLRREVKKRGWLCYKFSSPSHSGVPDDIIIGNGLTIFVECKAKNGKLSELQKKNITEMKARGAYVCVVYTREQVDQLLEVIAHGKTEQTSSGNRTGREKPPNKSGA